MYHIAVCDDTPEDIQLIFAMVQRWAAARGAEIQTQTFSSAENFLFHYAEDKQYDILLLDVEMGEMDGVSLAKRLRQAKDPVQIVFITGYSDYIAEGYEVSALHYLMKPVREEKLMDVLDRAAQRLQVEERALFLKLEGEMVRVILRDIRYLEVQQNYVTIHAGQDYTLKSTLAKLAEELDERFFQLGRSYIVNLHFVQRVTRQEAILQDGARIPLPRGYYDKINRAIIERC